MVTISLCMIVKNEEDVIGRCLDSVSHLVDEINIIDTGSTDQTKEIVGQYTDRIFDFEWIDDFAAARNFSFQQATKQYILWLDADDIFTAEDMEKFKLLKAKLEPDIDAVSMDYYLSFDEDGNVNSFLRRHRLVKKEKNYRWIGAVHEYLSIDGKIMHSDVAVTHIPLSRDHERNLRIYQNLLTSGKSLSPRDTFYFANELMDHGHYEDAVHYYETFLSSKLGWVEDNIRACFKLADCYQTLEKEEEKLSAILRSFSYDIPRPEAYCRLGFHFMAQDKNQEAVYWYQQALRYKSDKPQYFQNTSFSTWLPHLQLCVLYDRLQKFEEAYHHNEQARAYRPQHKSIIQNQKYFKKLFEEKNPKA